MFVAQTREFRWRGLSNAHSSVVIYIGESVAPQLQNVQRPHAVQRPGPQTRAKWSFFFVWTDIKRRQAAPKSFSLTSWASDSTYRVY
jgi:hypothetical protein